MSPDAAIRDLEEAIRACADHARLFDLYGRLGQLQALAGWKLFAPVERPDRLLEADRPDCRGCLALRGTSRLLAESALYLIDRNAELTRQLEAYRKRDRRHAELLSGLADLQKASGA